MDGINFNITPQNPMPGMMQALQFGQAIGGIRDQRTAAAAQAEKERQAALAAQQAAEAKAARDAEVAEMFSVVHREPTAENYTKLANMMPPQEAESIRKSFTMLDDATQQATLNEAANVFAAFKSGNIPIARMLLDEKIAAYQNSGNKQGVEKTKALRDMMDTGPDGVKAVEDFFGITLTAIPGGKDAVDAIAKIGEEQRAAAAEPTARKQALAQLGLTEAQINETIARTRKLDAEIVKMNDELAAAKQSGGLDPEKKFASELSLNKEYNTRTKGYDEALEIDSIIKTSAADTSGAGDLALVTSFMKMLDKGSVVRDTEFAKAQDTSGLIDKLKTSAQKVASGQFLTPEQRNDFVRLAGKYMEASTKNEAKVRDGLNFMVKSYGLNPQNVFGTMDKKNPIDNISSLREHIKKNNPGTTRNVDAMSEDEIKAAFPVGYAAFKPAATSQPIIEAGF